ncbi:Nuclear fusion defective [Thalictrum thalictroides]|uniref:Nuclear fusion defective n=1 Tax=Thalictrum thalictroides TaxID=46969 RepID=A0A7J6WG31_THATH|nr:Nuclear fusion defective [Thalictrum thalictroides]
MAGTGTSCKWMIVIATVWIQAFTGTNFNFSAYSTQLKSVLGTSQVHLNYLATASDMGKALGWTSGLALLYLSPSTVLFITALTGFVSYGLQWLLIQNILPLPYVLVFLLCMFAGCSISWFNTICFVLCIKNFPTNTAIALSLTSSFNGISPALYTLLAKAISLNDDSVYLLLNSVVPLITSFVALIPILHQPNREPGSTEGYRCDSILFLFLNILAVLTGLYLFVLNSISTTVYTARILFSVAILLLVLPLGIPGIVFATEWARQSIHSNLCLDGPAGFNFVELDDLEFHEELLEREDCSGKGKQEHEGCYKMVLEKDQLTVLGEEHPAHLLVRKPDFWLYFIAYFCGGTIGLVYSNNLGQIAQSLGNGRKTSTLVTLYSSCSFFGRLLSAAPNFICGKSYFARTGWLAIALVPTPVAFFLLAATGNGIALQVGTSLIGLSSGFIFSAALAITSELFGPNSAGVNHNILIINIPVGSLLYGLLAAIIYDTNAGSSFGKLGLFKDGALVCMGRQCYWETFVWWGCISMLGLASSVLLYLRTRPTYEGFKRNRIILTQ